jgi:cystathionine gamma-synthase
MTTETFEPSTIATRTGIESDTQYGAVVPPIHLSSTFSFSGYQQKRQYDYTRSGNPTRDHLAKAIADLEGGCGGVITSTGMSAITLICQLLGPQDLIVAPHDCYGGSYRLFDHMAKRGAFQVEFVNFNDPQAVAKAFKRQPKICWLETPSNPLLRITDIRAIADQRPASTLLVVDNTFLSPVGQQPLALGADVVVHSTTKYINGHSDVVGGSVVAKSPDIQNELAWLANCCGLTAAPFDCYLTLRGLRTLPLRFKAHEENAQSIAEMLNEHEAVDEVFYPGLDHHPGHKLAKSQQSSFGAMISFTLKGGEAAVKSFLKGLRCFSLAESLGGVESLIAHPGTMTHAAMSREARLTAGISDQLLRLSIGVEDVKDLRADVLDGLKRALRYASVA